MPSDRRSIAARPRARMPPARSFTPPRKPPGWRARRSRRSAAWAISTRRRPGGCGATPSSTRSAPALPKSAAGSSAASSSPKPHKGPFMQSDPIVIVSAARTPMGAFQGELKSFAAPELGAAAIRAAVERAKIGADEVSEVIMGCVLPAGQGQAPARQASLGAGLPLSTGCTTVNKMCGSGMKAAMLAHDILATGNADVIVAGGMESMTNAPYLLPKARAGLRMGHGQIIDHMFYDGLEDAYDKGRLMGSFAEDCARKFAFSREAQDEFAITSLARAQKANKEGWFAWELTPMAIKVGKEEKFVEIDEQPFKANIEKIPTLKRAFGKDGTVASHN